MNLLKICDLRKIIAKNRCAFLCGNGFSINFDDDYKYIYENLLKAHMKVIHDAMIEVHANKIVTKIFTDNFSNVKEHIHNYSQYDLDRLFNDGIEFAKSISENKGIIDDLINGNFLSQLVFDRCSLSLVEIIATVGNEKGYKSVNIEYWTILIYFYYAIKRLNSEKYQFPLSNEFIRLLEIGAKNNNFLINDGGKDLYQFVMANGFNIYYRLLFSTAILCDGKSVDCSRLTRINIIQTEKLICFLNSFELLMTLNYDHILEYLTGRNVTHIHGKYIVGRKEYVWCCSLRIKEHGHYISLSDILIGDYFINKTFAGITNSMVKVEGISKTITFSESIDKNIRNNNIEYVLLFGMNIDNDQHIIRNIMLSLEDRIRQDVGIIYCYFDKRDVDIFDSEYKKVITFSKEVSERVRKIPLYYIKTQDILDTYFY